MNNWDSSFITYRNAIQTKFLNNRLQQYSVTNGCTTRTIIENGSGATKESSNITELAIGEALTTLAILESTLDKSDCIQVPDAPTSVSAVAGNAQATITFTAPDNNGGAEITSYTVTSSPGAITATGSASPITVTGLTNGTSYTFTVVAINRAGNSEPSSSSTPVTPITVPSAPTALAISSVSEDSVTITFTAPASNGGATITNYKYSINNGTSYTAFSPADTTSPVTISGLSASTAYQVKLRAVNSVGDGTESSALSVTTSAPSASVPAAPTALSGVGGDNSIYVLFTPGANGGSAITNYEYSIDGGETFIPFSPEQTFSPVHIYGEGITNGVAYDVQLKAVNVVGAGAASATVTVTPTANTLRSTDRLIHLDATTYSGSGTTWTNLDSGGSYSATLQNGPTYDSTDGIFTFNGTDQIAEIAAASAINPTVGSSITVQIWARVNTASPNFGGGDGLISKQYWTPSYDGYSLGLNTNGSLYLKMNGSSVDGTYSSSAGVFDNQWALYTIVVRFGGGSGSPSYTYVSTRRVVSGNNNESGIPSNNAPLQFPRGIQSSGNNYCPADVGALYYYNTALSQEDIIRNYDATKSRYGY